MNIEELTEVIKESIVTFEILIQKNKKLKSDRDLLLEASTSIIELLHKHNLYGELYGEIIQRFENAISNAESNS